MDSQIKFSIQEHLQAQAQLTLPENQQFIKESALLIADCFRNGGKILIAGNGGSMCDAMHFAEELSGQFRKPRKALPAIALSDPGFLTCVSNDMGFDSIFSRGIEAFGKPGDVFIGMTTSGNSKNLVQGFQRAREMGLSTISFLGKSGGIIKGTCNLEMHIQGNYYSDRIQEVHMTAIHIIIEMIEIELFGQK